MLAGCAHSSGAPASIIAEPGIAPAYLPLYGRVHLGLDKAVGAAVVIAPGIAVTNAHNKNLLNEKSVLGVRRDYDLLFFRTARQAAPETAEPVKETKPKAKKEAATEAKPKAKKEAAPKTEKPAKKAKADVPEIKPLDTEDPLELPAAEEGNDNE